MVPALWSPVAYEVNIMTNPNAISDNIVDIMIILSI